jgi:LPXTG-motif cell wall-anchored protein
VALSVPGVMLEDGKVYTIFAMGLASGEPALTAVPSVDASYPVTLPVTGGEVTNLGLLVALGAGLVLVAGGLLLRRREAQVSVK